MKCMAWVPLKGLGYPRITQSRIIILTYPWLYKSGHLIPTYPWICKSRHLIPTYPWQALGYPNLCFLYLHIQGYPDLPRALFFQMLQSLWSGRALTACQQEKWVWLQQSAENLCLPSANWSRHWAYSKWQVELGLGVGSRGLTRARSWPCVRAWHMDSYYYLLYSLRANCQKRLGHCISLNCRKYWDSATCEAWLRGLLLFSAFSRALICAIHNCSGDLCTIQAQQIPKSLKQMIQSW